MGMPAIGELAWLLATVGTSTSTPLWLFSLSRALLLLLALLSPSSTGRLRSLSSPFVFKIDIFGARHDGSCHVTPVKLLTLNPLRSHLRHGFPVRSSARRPALIAPWLALGPSLWVASGATVVQGRAVGVPFSMAPCSLYGESLAYMTQ